MKTKIGELFKIVFNVNIINNDNNNNYCNNFYTCFKVINIWIIPFHSCVYIATVPA